MYSLRDFSEYEGEALSDSDIVLTWCRADGYMFKKVSEVGDRKVVAVED